MDAFDTVTVYSFQTFAEDAEGARIAPFKAQRDVIAERFGGQILEGTGVDVGAGELDAHGRYRRIATGWGELS